MVSNSQTAAAVGLSQIGIVLLEPQNPLNIGGCLRASLNMGISDLRLVRPRSMNPEEIAVTAPGRADAVASIAHFDSLQAATADAHLLVGFSARSRRADRQCCQLQELVAVAKQRLPAEGRLLMLFGREDFGLPNEALDRCDLLASIDTAEAYRSINLAQAVLLAAYEFRRASWQDAPDEPPPTREAISHQAFAGLIDQLDNCLDFIEFFKFPGARTSILRTLGEVFKRAQLSKRELSTLRGVFAEVVGFGLRSGISPLAQRSLDLPATPIDRDE
jgi:TrmH family RNA methyltransferase